MHRPVRVLYVCFGNAIRSQMAEAMSRHYGAGVIEAHSAGVMPALMVAPLTRKVLAARGIELGEALPKPVSAYRGAPFDLVINMSGCKLDELQAPVREWKIRDPIGQAEGVYEQVAEEIERRVIALIDELRRLRRQWEEFDSG